MAAPVATRAPATIVILIINGAWRAIIINSGWRRVYIGGRTIINRGTYREIDSDMSPIIVIGLSQAR